MFNNQPNRQPGNPFARIIIPILIYWAINFLVDIVVVAAYLAARAQDLLHAYESQTAFQTFMEETLTFALSHSTEITSAAAVLALPVYIYMMRKDEKYRRLFTVPDPDFRQNTGMDLSVCSSAWSDSRSCAEHYPDSEQYQQHQRFLSEQRQQDFTLHR